MPRRKTSTTSSGDVLTKASSKELAILKRRCTNVKPERLKLNMIDSGVLVSVNYRGELIKINKSWTEFVLLMLSYIYDCYPQKFMKALERGKVCSQNFDVTRHPPAYNSYGNETYEIPRCPYFLMTNMNPTAVLKAVQGFPDALEVEDEDILLNINPKDVANELGLNIVDKIDIKSDLIPITELDVAKLDTYNFSVGYIWDTKFKASSFDAVAVRIIKYLAKKSRTVIDNAVKVSISPVVGITTDSNIVALETLPLTKGSTHIYYSNKSNLYTLKFIVDLLDKEGLPPSCVKIKVDKLDVK